MGRVQRTSGKTSVAQVTSPGVEVYLVLVNSGIDQAGTRLESGWSQPGPSLPCSSSMAPFLGLSSDKLLLWHKITSWYIPRAAGLC